MLSFDSVLSAIDTVGMVAFAISGALAAARQRMDVVGFVLIAVITGLGGGTLRDLLLGRLPLFWLRAPELLAIIAIAAVAVFLAAPRFRMGERLLVWADALGMALYAVLGAEIALLAGADPWAAMLMGVVTASFGGILRDVVCNEVPLLLTREIYLLAALAGAACFVSLRLTGVWRDHAVVAGMVVAFGIRAAAIRFGWSLPPYRER